MSFAARGLQFARQCETSVAFAKKSAARDGMRKEAAGGGRRSLGGRKLLSREEAGKAKLRFEVSTSFYIAT